MPIAREIAIAPGPAPRRAAARAATSRRGPAPVMTDTGERQEPHGSTASSSTSRPTSCAGAPAHVIARALEVFARRLDRLDRARDDPWTQATLALIDRLPATRAAELAEEVGRELLAFKRAWASSRSSA